MTNRTSSMMHHSFRMMRAVYWDANAEHGLGILLLEDGCLGSSRQVDYDVLEIVPILAVCFSDLLGPIIEPCTEYIVIDSETSVDHTFDAVFGDQSHAM